MSVLALVIFAFCSWAVFSPSFKDGVIAKNLLAIAAITSFVVVLDPHNVKAQIVAASFLLTGIAVWYFRRHHDNALNRSLQSFRHHQ